MALFFYNCMISLLYPFYRLLVLFVPKLSKFHKSRIESLAVLHRYVETKSENKRVVWLHGASQGEFDQALGILREIKSRDASIPVVITVFSLSVKKLQAEGAEVVFYLPLDFKRNCRKLISQMNPLLFVTMTWDVWPNLLNELQRKNIPSYMSSAALAADSSRLKFPFILFHKPIYKLLSGIGTVDEINRKRFLQLLPDEEKVKTTGDSRFDTIFHRLESAKIDDDDLNKLKEAGQPVLILASTYRACDLELFPFINAFLKESPNYHIWIFPHHVHEERLNEMSKHLDDENILYTFFSKSDTLKTDRVVIVDRLGILALAYQFGSLCYVGGGFHHRIHNTAEGAAFGLPVFTGPKIETSPIALELEQEKLLFRCKNGSTLYQLILELTEDKKRLNRISERSIGFMKQKRGGSRLFYDTFLKNILGMTIAMFAIFSIAFVQSSLDARPSEKKSESEVSNYIYVSHTRATGTATAEEAKKIYMHLVSLLPSVTDIPLQFVRDENNKKLPAPRYYLSTELNHKENRYTLTFTTYDTTQAPASVVHKISVDSGATVDDLVSMLGADEVRAIVKDRIPTNRANYSKKTKVEK